MTHYDDDTLHSLITTLYIKHQSGRMLPLKQANCWYQHCCHQHCWAAYNTHTCRCMFHVQHPMDNILLYLIAMWATQAGETSPTPQPPCACNSNVYWCQGKNPKQEKTNGLCLMLVGGTTGACSTRSATETDQVRQYA